MEGVEWEGRADLKEAIYMPGAESKSLSCPKAGGRGRDETEEVSKNLVIEVYESCFKEFWNYPWALYSY